MDWRERVYKTYLSHYVIPAKGEPTIEKIEKQFYAWDVYYGRLLPKNKEAVILDAGCGTGEIVHWLRKLGFKNAIGIELDFKQTEAAKNLGISGILSGDFRESLKDKKNSYDCIIARDVIEHFDKNEILETLDLFYNSLKIGGLLIIQTPNAESPFGSRHRYCDFTHSLSFTETSLNHALKTASFKEVGFYPVRPVAHGIKSLIRLILWGFIETLIGFYLLIETGSGKGIFTQNMVAAAKK